MRKDADDETTVNTSMRLPAMLPDAAALAVDHLGVASSTTAMTAAALRAALETAVMTTVLASHYQQHPEARPRWSRWHSRWLHKTGRRSHSDRTSSNEPAVAVTARHPDADADYVLLWAETQRAATA